MNNSACVSQGVDEKSWVFRRRLATQIFHGRGSGERSNFWEAERSVVTSPCSARQSIACTAQAPKWTSLR
jgi:hypothetical protein